MDEMRNVRDFRQEIPEPSRRSLLPARDRLVDEATTARGALRGLLRLRRPRLGIPQVATAGALSIVLAGGLVAVQTVDFGDDPGATPSSSARAAVILQKAADAARSEQAPKPAGDFTYVETKVYQSHDGRSTISQWRRWNSVDGSQPGGWLVREAELDQPPRPGNAPPETQFGAWTKGHISYSNEPSLSAPTYEYLRTLPGDPDALLRELQAQSPTGGRGRSGGEGNVEGQHVRVEPRDVRNNPWWETFGVASIHELFLEEVVPPKVRAALFEVTAELPDVTVTENAALPLTGEHGIAVRYSVSYAGEGGQEQYELVFDPETYELLGTRHLANGEVIESAAIVQKGFVDRIGQRP